LSAEQTTETYHLSRLKLFSTNLAASLLPSFLRLLQSFLKRLRSKRFVLSALSSSNYISIYEYDGGVKLSLNKLCDHNLNYSLLWRSKCEPLKRTLVSMLISFGFLKDKQIYDIGAYIGDNALPWLALSSLLNQNISVYAIDPCQSNIEFMHATAVYNNLELKVLCSLISDRIENYTPLQSWTHSSFHVSNNPQYKSIRSTTIDSLYSSSMPSKVGLLHIDVEGMEYAVLNGASKLILENRPLIIYELHLNDPSHSKPGLLLHSQGYKIYTINEIISGNRPDCRNMIAIPGESTLISDLSFFSSVTESLSGYYPIVIGPPVIPYLI